MVDQVPLSLQFYKLIALATSPLQEAFAWPRILPRDVSDSKLQLATNRPHGELVWFHAASVGEAASAFAIIKRCITERPSLSVLLTTREAPALAVAASHLGDDVLYQFAPLDTPSSVSSFLSSWRPTAVVLMESELWPILLTSPLLQDVPLALLNARMSPCSFTRWHHPWLRPLADSMLRRFALVSTTSMEQALQFQLLGASPSAIHFARDLKFTTQGFLDSQKLAQKCEALKSQMAGRKVWLAASTHAGEEEAVARIHASLCEEIIPSLLTVIVPRHPERAPIISQMLSRAELSVSRRSAGQPIRRETQVYLADTMGELPLFYSSIPLSFIGASLLPSMNGHNVAEAAAASTAVLVGQHLGPFAPLVAEMQSHAPLSVWQVKDEAELRQAVVELLGNEAKLSARRIAAKRAFSLASSGVVEDTWQALDAFLLSRLGSSYSVSGSSNGGGNATVGKLGGVSLNAVGEVEVREDGPDKELTPLLQARRERMERMREPGT